MSIMLISVADAKSFLEIDESISTFDTLLSGIIKGVSARFELYLNRNLKKESRTEYFQAGGRKYFMSAYPIDSTITPTVILETTPQTIDEDFYVWWDDGTFEFDYNTSYVGPKQLIITYTGGYPTTTTAIGGTTVSDTLLTSIDSLWYACLLQVAYVFRRRQDIGLTSVSMPDGSISSAGGMELLAEVKKILSGLRKTPNER